MKVLFVNESVMESERPTTSLYFISTDLHLYSHYAVSNETPSTVIVLNAAKSGGQILVSFHLEI